MSYTINRPWGADALEVDAAPGEGADLDHVPLLVLAKFHRPKAVEALIRCGLKRRTAKRRVTRMLKIDRLKKKRAPR